MLDEGLKIVVRVLLVGVTITALVLLGDVVSKLVIWDWLTQFFVIMRKTIGILNFMIDTDVLFKLVEYSFILSVAYWGFKAAVWIVKFFNEK